MELIPEASPGEETKRSCANCHTSVTPLWRRFGQDTFLCNACGLYQRVNGNHRPVGKFIKGRRTGNACGNFTEECTKNANIISCNSNNNKRTGLSCSNCGTLTTSMWRRNPSGQPVCNACGLYKRLNGIDRPPEMRRESIRTRKRRTKPMLMLHAMLGPDFFSDSGSDSKSTDTDQSSLEKLLKFKPKLISDEQAKKLQNNEQLRKINNNNSGSGNFPETSTTNVATELVEMKSIPVSSSSSSSASSNFEYSDDVPWNSLQQQQQQQQQNPINWCNHDGTNNNNNWFWNPSTDDSNNHHHNHTTEFLLPQTDTELSQFEYRF